MAGRRRGHPPGARPSRRTGPCSLSLGFGSSGRNGMGWGGEVALRRLRGRRPQRRHGRPGGRRGFARPRLRSRPPGCRGGAAGGVPSRGVRGRFVPRSDRRRAAYPTRDRAWRPLGPKRRGRSGMGAEMTVRPRSRRRAPGSDASCPFRGFRSAPVVVSRRFASSAPSAATFTPVTAPTSPLSPPCRPLRTRSRRAPEHVYADALLRGETAILATMSFLYPNSQAPHRHL